MGGDSSYVDGIQLIVGTEIGAVSHVKVGGMQTAVFKNIDFNYPGIFLCWVFLVLPDGLHLFW